MLNGDRVNIPPELSPYWELTANDFGPKGFPGNLDQSCALDGDVNDGSGAGIEWMIHQTNLGILNSAIMGNGCEGLRQIGNRMLMFTTDPANTALAKGGKRYEVPIFVCCWVIRTAITLGKLKVFKVLGISTILVDLKYFWHAIPCWAFKLVQLKRQQQGTSQMIQRTLYRRNFRVENEEFPADMIRNVAYDRSQESHLPPLFAGGGGTSALLQGVRQMYYEKEGSRGEPLSMTTLVHTALMRDVRKGIVEASEVPTLIQVKAASWPKPFPETPVSPMGGKSARQMVSKTWTRKEQFFLTKIRNVNCPDRSCRHFVMANWEACPFCLTSWTELGRDGELNMFSSIQARNLRAQVGTYQEVIPQKPATVADHLRELQGMIGDALDKDRIREQLRRAEADEQGQGQLLDQGPVSNETLQASHLFCIRPFEPAWLTNRQKQITRPLEAVKICDEILALGFTSWAQAFVGDRAFGAKYRALGPCPTFKREMPMEARAGLRQEDEKGGLRQVPNFVGTFDDFATRCGTLPFGEGFRRDLTETMLKEQEKELKRQEDDKLKVDPNPKFAERDKVIIPTSTALMVYTGQPNIPENLKRASPLIQKMVVLKERLRTNAEGKFTVLNVINDTAIAMPDKVNVQSWTNCAPSFNSRRVWKLQRELTRGRLQMRVHQPWLLKCSMTQLSVR